MAAEQELTATSYIQHHLSFNAQSVGDGAFWTLHVDSLVTGVILGVVATALMWWVVRGATSGVPNKRQAFVELLFGFVDDQVKGIFHGKRDFVAPTALTVFVWVLLMNAMDFLPVDIMAWILTHVFHQHEFRIVPTADVNTTFALSLSVWLLMIYFSIAVKGLGGWIHELFCAPFGVESAAVAVQFPVQPGRIRVQAAVAFAAAVRQHVCGRDHFPAVVAVGRDQRQRRVLRRHPRRRLVDIPHPDRGAAGVHLHDAHHRVHLDGA